MWVGIKHLGMDDAISHHTMNNAVVGHIGSLGGNAGRPRNTHAPRPDQHFSRTQTETYTAEPPPATTGEECPPPAVAHKKEWYNRFESKWPWGIALVVALLVGVVCFVSFRPA